MWYVWYGRGGRGVCTPKEQASTFLSFLHADLDHVYMKTFSGDNFSRCLSMREQCLQFIQNTKTHYANCVVASFCHHLVVASAKNTLAAYYPLSKAPICFSDTPKKWHSAADAITSIVYMDYN